MGLRLCLADATGRAVGEHPYRLCGIDVTCDLALPSLAPFKRSSAIPNGLAETRREPVLSSSRPARYETVGFTGGRDRHVVLETAADGARLEIDGVGSYVLAPDGSGIVMERVDVSASLDLIEECTLGAPLIIALAAQDCWFLHAAAVAVNGRATVIAGSSGAGKSTLADKLNQQPGCRRIADDLIGLRMDAETLMAFSDYPQLKLPPTSRAPYGPMSVGTIYLLKAAVCGESFRARRLVKSEKVISLLQHGVTARLFPTGLLDRHFTFCRMAAVAVDIIEITYPHSIEGLGRAIEGVKEAGLHQGR